MRIIDWEIFDIFNFMMKKMTVRKKVKLNRQAFCVYLATGIFGITRVVTAAVVMKAATAYMTYSIPKASPNLPTRGAISPPKLMDKPMVKPVAIPTW